MESNKVCLTEPIPPGILPDKNLASVLTTSTSAPAFVSGENDTLPIILWELLQGEKLYNQELQTVLEAAKLLDDMGALKEKELHMLDDCLLFLHNTSCGLIENLDQLTQSFHTLEIGDFLQEISDLFGISLHREYLRYHWNFSRNIIPLLKNKRRFCPAYDSACFQVQKIFGDKFLSLLCAPEHRLVTYHSRLEQIYKSAPATPSEEFRQTVEKIGKLAKEADREVGIVKNELHLEEIETKFPTDELDLTAETKNQTMNQLIRRKSTGTEKSLSKSKSLPKQSTMEQVRGFDRQFSGGLADRGGRRSSDSETGDLQPTSQTGDQSFSLAEEETKPRNDLRGLQTQERYLFLFSDLLLVAKEKGVNSYKLKEKIRLCEVWLKSDGIEEVSECGKFPDRCFVIGWPTTNYVAEFGSVQERNDWYGLLDKTIGQERDKEYPKVVTVKVHYKTIRSNQVKTVKLNCYSTATDFLRMALVEFQLDDEPLTPHQLWVRSGKENAAYPLLGHESPFAIYMSHVRDTIPEGGGSEMDLREFSEDLSGLQRVKCFFILRPKQGVGLNVRKLKSKRQTAGHFMEMVKKRMTLSKQESVEADGRYFQNCAGPKPLGVLFGRDLATLVTDKEPVPRQIMMLMEHIFQHGVFLDGIFRKSPKHSTVRFLKEKLDNGEEVKLDGEYYPTVTASVLKDFLRNIPGSLLKSDLYNDWIALCDKKEPEKPAHVKNLLFDLPSANYDLLKHLMCLLHYVAEKSGINQMNSTSLAVCVGPSLLEKAENNVQESVRLLPHVAQYLIDNVVDLFGADTLDLFGKPPRENSFGKTGSSEESDPGHIQPETSSMDSLNVSSAVSPGQSRPESSSLVRHPANLSRDSGLSDVHFTDEFSVGATHSPSPHPGPTGRSFSQGEAEAEEITFVNTSTQSVEDLSTREKMHIMDVEEERQRSATLDQRSESEKPPWDHLEMDERNDSIDYLDQTYMTGLRNSKRLATGTLQRSESGEHLLLSELPGEKKALPGTQGTAKKNLRQKGMTLSLPVSGDLDLTSDSNSSSPDSSMDPMVLAEPAKMSRESNYRKPARYRKHQAHKTSSLSPEEEEEEEQEQEKHEDVSGLDSQSGKIVIRCNSKDGVSPPMEASTESRYSFRGLEPHSEASSSGASSLTSLTSDSDGSPEPMAGVSEAKQLLSDVHHSLNEAKNKIKDSKRGSFSRSHFLETVNTADSSTVTETSSDEEESTPVVSRESSRAQELKGKAKEMFAAAGIGARISSQELKKPVSLAPLGVSRPSPSFSAWQAKYNQPRNRQMGAGVQSSLSASALQSRPLTAASAPTITRQTVSTSGLQPRSKDSLPLNAARLQRYQPEASTTVKSLPNYEETVRRGLVARQPSLTKPEFKSTAPVPPVASYQRSASAATIVQDQKLTTVPYVPGQVQDRIRRYDREGLRRKTMGGEELLDLAQKSRMEEIPVSSPRKQRLVRTGSLEKLPTNPSPSPRNPSPSPTRNYILNQPPSEPQPVVVVRKEVVRKEVSRKEVVPEPTEEEEPPARGEISWSVNKLKTIFDDQQKIPDRLKSGRRVRSDGISSLDRHPPPSESNKRLSAGWSQVLTSGGVLTVSDAQTNYPVVKPPPLAPAYSKIREAPIAQLTLIKSPTTEIGPGGERMGKPGLVKNLVSTFDGGNVSSGKNQANESYV